jgi:hypothetical protein
MKYLAYNKITEKNYIIAIDDTWIWPNPINIVWTDFSFSSYLDWEHFRREWEIIRKVEDDPCSELKK